MTVTHDTLCYTPGVDSTKVDKTGSRNQVVFELGSTEELTWLYSYPNSYDDNETTLEQTIEHYLSQSLDRDLTINGRADVTVNGDTYNVIISGDGEHVTNCEEQINSFLSSGRLALQAVSDLKRDNIWNEKDWCFSCHMIVNYQTAFYTTASLPTRLFVDWAGLSELQDVPVSAGNNCWS